MVRALIIDDDLSASGLLNQMLVERNVSIEGTAHDGYEGMQLLLKHKPDVVFLDVEMPRMSGFDLLAVLPSVDFHIIFVTAYDKYALQAIQFSAIDYLLKPVNAELLDKALEKINNRFNKIEKEKQYQILIDNLKTQEAHLKTMALPTREGFVFVPVKDIVHCDAEGSYTKVSLADKSNILVSRCLKEFENLLDTHIFFRVHNSHVINMEHIKKYNRGEGGYVVMSDDAMIEVARSRKEEFLNLIMKV